MDMVVLLVSMVSGEVVNLDIEELNQNSLFLDTFNSNIISSTLYK